MCHVIRERESRTTHDNVTPSTQSLHSIDSGRGINVKQHSIQCFSKQKSHCSRPAVSREISASQNIASRVFRSILSTHEPIQAQPGWAVTEIFSAGSIS